MASGFFLGGTAEGIMGDRQQTLRERTQTDAAEIARGQLGLQERQFGENVRQQLQKEADERIAATMGVVAQTIQGGLEGGASPDAIRRAVAPLVQSAGQIAQRVGRDPNALVAQMEAQLTMPDPVRRAEVRGAAGGRERVSTAAEVQQIPLPPRQTAAPPPSGTTTTPPARVPNVNLFENEQQRVQAENTLRDDYMRRSTDFVTQRDFFDRIQTSPVTGAGDIGLVFSYMKVLDPTSTVREGEFATARNAAGVPSAVHAMYNRLIGGGVLGDQARNEIKQAAQTYFTQAATRHNQLTRQFSDIARRQGLRVPNVIVDFTERRADTLPGAPGDPRFGPIAPVGENVTSGGNRWR